MAFCTNCGSEIPEGTKFCANCGAPVGNAQNDGTNAGGNSVPETSSVSSAYAVNNQSVYEQDVYLYSKYISIKLLTSRKCLITM